MVFAVIHVEVVLSFRIRVGTLIGRGGGGGSKGRMIEDSSIRTME